VFLISLAVYAATANRGAQWQDSGAYILSITTGELKSPLGLALTHPLHYGLGRLSMQLLSFAEPSAAITWVSSLAAALTIANVFGAARCLTGNGWAALFAAASLAVGHTFWRLATIAEVYPVSAALLAGECWCLIAFLRRGGRGYLRGMLLLNGLGIANHLQATLTAPVLGLVTLFAVRAHRVTWGQAVTGTALWLLGTLPYSSLVVHELLVTGDWPGTVQSALLGNGGVYQGSVFNLSLSLKCTVITLGFVLLSFPNLFLPAAVYGLVKRRTPGIPIAVPRALIAGLLIHSLFVLRYDVIDQYTFMLPTYVFLALFAAIGAAVFFGSPDPAAGRLLVHGASRTTSGSGVRWASSRRAACTMGVLLLMATPALYALAPMVTRHSGVLERAGLARHKPYRDDDVYLFVPWACADRSAEQMSRAAVSLAGDAGRILAADPMGRDAICYRAIREGQTDIQVTPFLPKHGGRILEDAVVEALSGRRVVFVPADVTQPAPPGVKAERHNGLFLITGPDVSQAPD